MLQRTALALGFACVLALPLAAMGATPHAAATGDAAGHYRTVLQDAKGKAIDRAQFETALRHGQRYVSLTEAGTDTIALRLLPPGVATPDSFAPTDLGSLQFTWINAGGHHYAVEFHGVDGQRIDRATFTANAAHGQRYTQVLDAKAGAAILTLLPPGVSKPGSQPTSKWIVSVPKAGPAGSHDAG